MTTATDEARRTLASADLLPATCPYSTPERRAAAAKRMGSECCCCLKERFQPWHGRYCPHGLSA